MGLFKKAALFTDIHFGEHLDSEQHNKDCLEFVEWFAGQVRAFGCDAVIFLGDWFHNRVRTENRTGYYSRLAIEILHGLGIPVFFIIGNHELYEKAGREIHSLPHLPRYDNFHLINEITQIDDVVFSPWLVQDEHEDLVARKCRYIFGHFELPFFLMNQVIQKVYDGHGLHTNDFTKCEAVYSGHFHKRQVRMNKWKIPICYIGNAFGHNMNDANDPERGMAVLEWGEITPQYISWPNQPTYHKWQLSEFLELAEHGERPYGPRAVVEITDDLNLPTETINEIKSIVEARQVRVNKTRTNFENETVPEIVLYKSLDDMIVTKLKTMNYDGNYDPNLLVSLYMGV